MRMHEPCDDTRRYFRMIFTQVITSKREAEPGQQRLALCSQSRGTESRAVAKFPV